MANNEMKAQIVVDLDEKGVVIGARKVIQNTDKMTNKIVNGTKKQISYYQRMNKELNNTSKNMTGFATKIAAAYGGVQAIKMVWEYNDGLKDTARRLNWSTTQIDQHKQALFDLQLEYGAGSYSFGQFVDEIARGAQTSEEFIAKARLGAIAMRGLTMEGKESAAVLAMLDEAGVRDPEYMLNRFANIGQASNGRFKSSEIATGTYEVMKNSSLAKNEETVLQVSSMLQALSGSNETIGDAVSKLNAIINDMSGSDFREFAKKRTGQDVFKVEDNKLVLKNLQSLIDIMAKDTEKGEYKNKLWYDQWRTLQGRLSADAASGIQGLAGQGDTINKIKGSQGINANQTALDRSRNFDASMEKLMATMQRFADMNLADPIERFAIAMSQLDPSDIQNLMNEAKKAADIIGVAFGVFAGAKALESVSIKSAGTVTVAAVLGKIAIDYFAEKANQKLDERGVKNETDFQMLDREVIKKYSAVAGEGLPNELINALALKVDDWNKLGLHQNQEDMVIAALDFLKNQAGEKAFQDIRANKETTYFAFPWNQIDSNDPAKNLDIINRGKVDFKSGVDVQKLQQDLQKAIDVQKNIENIKFKAQEVDVKISVKSDDNLRVTTISKESTVKGKLGYTGGGDY